MVKWSALLLWWSASVWAGVDVVFIQIKNYQGEIIRLEPGGRFAHIAISYRGGWLHSHPVRGVEWITTESLRRLGSIEETIHLEDVAELTPGEVHYFLGRPYDDDFTWNDDRIYCSELVAKLLGIEPLPMKFDEAIWPAGYRDLEGTLGISPDDLYSLLRARQLRTPKSKCSPLSQQPIAKRGRIRQS